jgi:hypothetical protein
MLPAYGCAMPSAGRLRMTKDEFDQAIEAIRQGHITTRERRVIAAATFMMQELCSVPDNLQPTLTQIIEFIDSLDNSFRGILSELLRILRKKNTQSTKLRKD